jgi:CBS domain-containing protein
VDAKDSVGDALRALSERGVLSALVTERDEEDDDEMEEDEEKKKKKKKKKKKDPRAVRYRGFLSVNDVVLDLVSRGADEDARETLVRGLAAVAGGGGAATEVEPSREELERAREAWNWPSLPVSEIMSPVNWQDGRVMFAPDDPSFDGVSALSLVASRFFSRRSLRHHVSPRRVDATRNAVRGRVTHPRARDKRGRAARHHARRHRLHVRRRPLAPTRRVVP